jgi:type II secretory pathway component GspD/PulD (secretin)
VTAKQSKIDEIAKTIQELDQETTRSDRTERIALKHGEAEDVAQTLVELYQDQQRGARATGERPPSITADPGTNSILVYASQAQLDRIRPLIQELDTEQQADAPEVIKLEKATASEVLSVLTQVFAEQGRQRSGRRSGPQAEPVIQALDTSNSLIVRARPREMGLIKSMVKTLDSETAVGLTSVKVIQLKEGVDVRDMASNIERLINEGEQNKARATPGVKPNQVSIGSDDRTNSLIVAGSPAQFGVVEQLARKLEEMGPSGPKVIRIIPLRNIQSDEVKRLINQLIDEQKGGRTGSSRRRGFGPRSCLDRIPETLAFRAA